MGRIYEQDCRYCNKNYKGEGRLYCSVKCRSDDIVTPETRKKISIAQKKSWTPERRKRKSEFNKARGIRPPGFQKGHKTWNLGGTSWNKGIPRTKEELENIKSGIKTAGRDGEKNANWRGGLESVICLNCSEKFMRYPSIAKTAKYCSYVCAGIYRASQVNPKSNTLIERLMEQELVTKKIKFTPQKRLYSIAVADFYLDDYKIAIFCDGDYWHRLPGRQEDDARRTQSLQNKGIKVYRFWEKDIKTSVSECLNLIKEIC